MNLTLKRTNWNPARTKSNNSTCDTQEVAQMSCKPFPIACYRVLMWEEQSTSKLPDIICHVKIGIICYLLIKVLGDRIFSYSHSTMGIKSRALYMLGKYPATQLHHQLWKQYLSLVLNDLLEDWLWKSKDGACFKKTRKLYCTEVASPFWRQQINAD